MSKLFKKLNLKDQNAILALNSPESFLSELNELENIRIYSNLQKVKSVAFVIAFIKSADEIQRLAEPIAEKAPGDAVIWFAYPKKTSKKFNVSINRDQGWDALEKAGFKAVRQVAIDQDWSAIRFRRKNLVGK
ncbi:MAG: hypothetical protein ACOCYU_06225 [Brevefilum sp.]